MKTCSHCKTEKPLTEFYKNKSTPTGAQSVCKFCKKETSLEYRKANLQYFAAASRKYYSKNKESRAVYNIKYKSSNRVLLNAKLKAWKEANKEKYKAYRNQYQKQYAVDLIGHYVKTLIVRNGSVTREQIPIELIEAKRLHLQIIRKLKELKA